MPVAEGSGGGARAREEAEAARKAAEAAAEAAKAEAANAREAADQRVQENKSLPSSYFTLPLAERELLSAAFFHVQAAQRRTFLQVRQH